ncbi:hypothetical protein HK102_011162, partial [Quaeritorhiza haematococci]
LVQILNNDARERLSRIAIVKPDKARAVEDMLIRMAQTGQVREKIGERQLVDMLEQISQTTKTETTIKFNRRRSDSDDEDDWGI